MAEENNQENEKKSPLKLILMIVGSGITLRIGNWCWYSDGRWRR